MDKKDESKYKTLAVGLTVDTDTKERYHIHAGNVAEMLEKMASGALKPQLKDVERINFKECGSRLVPGMAKDCNDEYEEDLTVARFYHLFKHLPGNLLESLKLVNVERVVHNQQYVKSTALNRFLNRLEGDVQVRVKLDIVAPPVFPVEDDAVFAAIKSLKLQAAQERDVMHLFPGHEFLPESLEKLEFRDLHDAVVDLQHPLQKCHRLRKLHLCTNYTTIDWIPDTVSKLTISDNAKPPATVIEKDETVRQYPHVKKLSVNIHRDTTNPVNESRFPNAEVVWAVAHCQSVNWVIKNCLSESHHIHTLALGGQCDAFALLDSPSPAVKVLNLSLLEVLPNEPEKCALFAKLFPAVEAMEMGTATWSTALGIAFLRQNPSMQLYTRASTKAKRAAAPQVETSQTCHWDGAHHDTLTVRVMSGLTDLNKAAKEINGVIGALKKGS